MSYRIGIGYDIHKLVKGRKLILGGVNIPFKKGLLGHSDADVLTHAICDALLGAAGLGNIGEHFPNTEKEYKNISSMVLLGKVKLMLKQNGLKIGNIDSTVIAELPKIGPHKNKMRQSISSILEIEKSNINIKATTNEGISDLGKTKAIAAFAVASIHGGQ